MLVNPAGLTDPEVRASLAQIAQTITLQAQAITDQVNRQNVQRENPPIRTMADRVYDLRGPQEFVDEVHKILVSMGATDTEKANLDSYQLKDVTQSWCKMWQDSQALGGVTITWELFKTAFLERFFPREMRETKGLLRISRRSIGQLCCMTVWTFPDLWSMSSKWRKEEYTRPENRSRKSEENFSRKSSTKIRDKPRFKKGLSHKGESNSSKGRYDRNSESRVKRNNEVDTLQERPPCRKCGKLHGGECMMGTNACYSCGKPGHMVNDCPNRRRQEQGKRKFNLMVQVKRIQGGNNSSIKSRGAGERNSGEVSGW
nr:uncharacterized protein LOC104644722 [Solanum lycopersicum]